MGWVGETQLRDLHPCCLATRWSKGNVCFLSKIFCLKSCRFCFAFDEAFFFCCYALREVLLKAVSVPLDLVRSVLFLSAVKFAKFCTLLNSDSSTETF